MSAVDNTFTCDPCFKSNPYIRTLSNDVNGYNNQNNTTFRNKGNVSFYSPTVATLTGTVLTWDFLLPKGTLVDDTPGVTQVRFFNAANAPITAAINVTISNVRRADGTHAVATYTLTGGDAAAIFAVVAQNGLVYAKFTYTTIAQGVSIPQAVRSHYRYIRDTCNGQFTTTPLCSSEVWIGQVVCPPDPCSAVIVLQASPAGGAFVDVATYDNGSNSFVFTAAFLNGSWSAAGQPQNFALGIWDRADDLMIFDLAPGLNCTDDALRVSVTVGANPPYYITILRYEDSPLTFF